jgi:hypothetical protein
MAPLWRSRRSVAFIIDTNGARPERPARRERTSDARLPGTALLPITRLPSNAY